MQSTNVNTELSEFLAIAVGARGGQCYMNAYLALWVPGFSHCDYVQGFAVGGNDPIEHCWLECDGEILDPTILVIGPDYTYFLAEKFNAASRVKAEKYLGRPEVLLGTRNLREPEALPFASLLGEARDFDSELFIADTDSLETTPTAGATYMKVWQAAWKSVAGRTPEIGPREVRARLVEHWNTMAQTLQKT